MVLWVGEGLPVTPTSTPLPTGFHRGAIVFKVSEAYGDGATEAGMKNPLIDR